MKVHPLERQVSNKIRNFISEVSTLGGAKACAVRPNSVNGNWILSTFHSIRVHHSLNVIS